MLTSTACKLRSLFFFSSHCSIFLNGELDIHIDVSSLSLDVGTRELLELYILVLILILFALSTAFFVKFIKSFYECRLIKIFFFLFHDILEIQLLELLVFFLLYIFEVKLFRAIVVHVLSFILSFGHLGCCI